VTLLSPVFHWKHFADDVELEIQIGTKPITRRHHPYPDYCNISGAIGRPTVQPLFDTFFAVILLKTSNPLAPIGLLAESIALCGSNVLLGAIV
jgi:hypothetical protein